MARRKNTTRRDILRAVAARVGDGVDKGVAAFLDLDVARGYECAVAG